MVMFSQETTDFEKTLLEKAHRMFNLAWSKGQLGVVYEVLSKDFVRHDPDNPTVQGADGYAALIVKMRTAFPDLTVHIHELIANKRSIWARLTITGTHLGEFVGVGPTGAKMVMAGQMTAHFNDDAMAVEGWASTDYLGLIRDIIQAMSWWQFLLNLPAIINQSGLGRSPETPIGEAGLKGWSSLLDRRYWSRSRRAVITGERKNQIQRNLGLKE